MMEPPTLILLILILIFGFYMAWSLGANDAANALGTSVGSGALTLKKAILLAALFEFAGVTLFGNHVSTTIQSGLVDPAYFSDNPLIFVYGMLGTLLAAGIWLQFASYFGWPVSTTHSIVGAVVGFGIVISGVRSICWQRLSSIIISWILSPLMGASLSYLTFTMIRKKILFSPKPVHAAKRIIPWLVFFIITTLATLMLSRVITRSQSELSFLYILSLGCLLGSIGNITSRILLHRIIPHQHTTIAINHDPLLAQSFKKASKHLRKVQSLLKGEAYFQVSSVINEIGSIQQQLISSPLEPSTEHSDLATIERIFGYLQILSACFMAFAHGANDAANAIGPISACVSALFHGSSSLTPVIPFWILILGGLGILLGLTTWGWRVIETIGKKITELTPSRGFSAELGAASTIVIASSLGLPISTTHTLVGAVLGIGLARGIYAINLNTIKDICISWIITIPAGAILTILFFHILKFCFGG